MSGKKRVLFVCMGNICRSPTGEGVFAHLVKKRGLADRFEIDSAGTIGYHAGERADRRMRQAAQKRGYALESRARQVVAADLDTFDLIVAMDSANLADLQQLARAERKEAALRLLSDFLPTTAVEDGTWPKDVPDPYYGGPAGFEKVLDMIEAAAEGILDHLQGQGDAA
jgi:protein-tyrosine phosphatase